MTEETGTLGYMAPKDPFGKKLMDRIRPTQPRSCTVLFVRLYHGVSTQLWFLPSKEGFENLCLILGIELDAVTTEKAIIRKEKHIEEEEADDDEEVIYK
ncbi:hypothetical protein HID58_017968 [Brassica napus]|uniref:Uncharacterized protein n=1 Tax=Brassica napus TaxID=3708 RepID=A0ABQ8D8N3_BRANA|nr:hypothetical protein HID58_017968 [Brassica napus]